MSVSPESPSTPDALTPAGGLGSAAAGGTAGGSGTAGSASIAGHGAGAEPVQAPGLFSGPPAGDDRPTADLGPVPQPDTVPFSPASGLGSAGAGTGAGHRAGDHARSLDEGPGTAIGPYRVVEAIGEGGFGMVYLAEQLEPVRRRVALKVVKLGMDTKEVLARFQAERQALAMLEHPNIARVFDAGMTARGRPYFAMEYCPGQTITHYADSARLSTRQRVELLIPVCHAVQHAHSRGIIHRDLKPSNILVSLVDGRPVPKVIDFGIAKATDTRLTDRTLATEHGRLLGTPEYMSPEQAGSAGRDIDNRADVYSLGVILYELLTGTLPFESAALRAGSREQIIRMICELDPPRPSTRLGSLITRRGSAATTRSAPGRDGAAPAGNASNGAGAGGGGAGGAGATADPRSGAVLVAHIAELRRAAPPALVRQLRGDLDWIVLRAMAKSRADRYASANELGEDLERYLTHQPVRAGPPSPIYRLRKAAVRHRAALGAALLIAAAAGIVVVTLALYQRGKTAQTAQVNQIVASSQQRQNAAVAQAQADKYRAAIVLAEAAIREGDLATASRELAEAPQPLRGFEWKHLALSLDPSLLALPGVRPASTAALAFAADGRSLLAGDAQGRLWRVPVPGAGGSSSRIESTQLGELGITAVAVAPGPAQGPAPSPAAGPAPDAPDAADAPGAPGVPGASDPGVIAVGDEGGTVRLLDARTLRTIGLAPDPARAKAAAPTPAVPGPAAVLAVTSATPAVTKSAAAQADEPEDRPPPVGVVALAFSPDAMAVGALRADGSAVVVHARTGRQLPLAPLPPADGLVQSLLASPSGQSGLVLTAFTDRAAASWVVTGDALAALASEQPTPQPGSAVVPRIARLPIRNDSALAAAHSPSQTVSLLPRTARQLQLQRFLSPGNAQSLRERPLPLTAVLGSETALAVTPTADGEGTIVALGAADGLLRIWSVGPEEPSGPSAPPGQRSPRAAAAPRPGPRAAVDGPGPNSPGGAGPRRAATPPARPPDPGEPEWTFSGHSGPIAAVALSPDGTLAATLGREDGTLRLFSLTDGGTTAATLHIDRDRPMREYPGLRDTLTFSADGRRVAGMASPAFVAVWDTGTGAVLVKLPAFSASYTLDPQGRYLVGGGARGPREVIDVDRGQRLDDAEADAVLAGIGLHPGALMGIADAAVSIGRQEGRSITVTRYGRAEPVRVLPRPATGSPVGLLAGLTFSNSGRFMFYGSRVNTLEVIDLNSGSAIGRLEASRSVLGQFALSPDERTLYLADGARGVTVWDLETGKKRSTIAVRGETAGVAISADGSRLAVGLRGMGVLIIDPATGKELVTLRLGNVAVRGLAFSPDASVLAVSTDTGVELLRTTRP